MSSSMRLSTVPFVTPSPNRPPSVAFALPTMDTRNVLPSAACPLNLCTAILASFDSLKVSRTVTLSLSLGLWIRELRIAPAVLKIA